MQTGLGDVKIKAPETYQVIEGEKIIIPSGFEVHEEGQVSFLLAAYDENKPLIIDPELVYSTYLGGTGSDGAYGIDVDMQGNAYITGLTRSAAPLTTWRIKNQVRREVPVYGRQLKVNIQ